jgi:hypothetical protein
VLCVYVQALSDAQLEKKEKNEKKGKNEKNEKKGKNEKNGA